MLNNENIYEISKKIKNTRTAAGVELWKPYLSGSLVAINAALFHLLELIKNSAIASGNNWFSCWFCWC